jgi:hypothetical protein
MERRYEDRMLAYYIRSQIASLWKDLPGLTGGDWPKVAVLLVAAVRPELLLERISPDDPSLPGRLAGTPEDMTLVHDPDAMAERVADLLHSYNSSVWPPDWRKAFAVREPYASRTRPLRQLPTELLRQEVRAAVAAMWADLPRLTGGDWPKVAVLLVAAVRPELLLEPISPQSLSVGRELVDHPETAPAPDPDVTVETVVDLLNRYRGAVERLAWEARDPQLEQRITDLTEMTGGPPAYGGPPPRTYPKGPTRYVNAVVVSAGTDQPVPGYEEQKIRFRRALDYELLVNIGRYVDGSLLPRSGAGWPDDLLPDQGVWLRAMLVIDGARTPDVRAFFLPREGESFACDCPVDGEHAQECARRPWVRFPLRTPDRPAVVVGDLVIYYQAVAVIAVQLILPFGAPDTSYAKVIGRLTSSFNDLGKLAGRAASVVVSPATSRVVVNGISLPATSRVVVNGISFVENPFAIGTAAADTSAVNARAVLFDSHFEVRGLDLHSRYDDDFAKAYTEYEQDLRRLAREGRDLYARLFSPPGSDNTAARTLPSLLRHEARTRGRPPVLQVIDDRSGEHAMLWSVIYDLPMGGDPARYEPCPSVRRFGPGGTTGEIPPVCPYEAGHVDRGNVLCPFGFWGLSCLVEQPPTVGRDLESVVYTGVDDVAVLVAAGTSLDGRLTERHLQRLQVELPDRRIMQPSLPTHQELAAALGPEDMDVVYFYCHCGYDERSKIAAADRYLQLGDYTIQPLDVNLWAETAWPDPHWPRRRPLIVLNGCHTTEFSSGTLNSFVPAFTQWGGASGVLGTEITLEQGLAGWVMEEVLTRLARGQSIGTALHQARWAMLSRGNLMGLAYTPYSLANLVLRPPATDQE